ncbi:Vacuolar morphogenesis protein 6 [Pseudogymnoascus australis]
MLSAFVARPIVELKARDKSKIESILAYGDRLIVGLSTGSLRIYRVNEPTVDVQNHNGEGGRSGEPTAPSTAKPVDLLRELEKFSPRAIEQLSRIKEANILISLSNYVVSIHDLQTYELQEQLPKTKNATTFAITSNILKDNATGIPEIISRLGVAVKRRLLVWSWHESELSPDVVEITLSAAIRTLSWASATKIICGMNTGYVIVDILSQEIDDIVGPGAIGGPGATDVGRFGGVGSASMGYMGLGGYTPKPLITRLRDGEILLAKDINSLFTDTAGKPLEKRQIPWQQAPESIGYSYPYLLSLQPALKGILEIRNPETLSVLQQVSLPSASILHFPPPTVSLSHAGKGFHVASDRCIWRMEATDYDSQITELVDGGQYDEAITILDTLEDALLEDKNGRLREIKMQKAQRLFDQRKYRAALGLFTEVSAPPERVIRLYPKVIAGSLSTIPDPVVPEDEGDHDEDAKVQDDQVADLSTVGSPVKGFVNNFMKQHKKTPSDAASISSLKSGQKGDSDSSETASLKTKQVEDGALEGKDLASAVRELNAFLVDTRTRLQRFIEPGGGGLKVLPANAQNGTSKAAFESLLVSPSSPADTEIEQRLIETAKLVDTTLFRAYMLVQPSLAGSLFRLPNFCEPDVVNEKLLENNRYNDLVDFFHGKKLHREALELLKRFGEAETSEESGPNLQGPERTVGYLQNLQPDAIDLILEFAEWPLRTDPDLGMEVFLADTENAETLPRDKVVDFLESIDASLVVRYLEHVINELNDLTPSFHNRLANAYIQGLSSRKDRDSESWKTLMQQSLSFLRSSKQYSPLKAFGSIPRDDPDFYEAQAVVLSSMEQHKQALEIYVYKIKDFDKAENYCNSVYLHSESSDSSTNRLEPISKTTDSSPSIYHTLLSLYLTPQPPQEPNWGPALDLLSKHGSRLPASNTLTLIPANLLVKDLESYFCGRIRAANSVVNEARVVTGLRKSEVVRAQAGLLLGEDESGGGRADSAGSFNAVGTGSGRNRHVVVGEERVCGVCHKRLGRSVVSVLPDNTVVHYACSKRAVQRGMNPDGGLGALKRNGGSAARDPNRIVL